MALQKSSYDVYVSESKPPKRKSDGEMFLFILLLVGGIVVVLTVPGVSAYFRNTFSHPPAPKMDPTVTVWVNRDSGTYYCAGDRSFGKGPGEMRRQGEALTAGYQPLFEHYCPPSNFHEPNSAGVKPTPSVSTASPSSRPSRAILQDR